MSDVGAVGAGRGVCAGVVRVRRRARRPGPVARRLRHLAAEKTAAAATGKLLSYVILVPWYKHCTWLTLITCTVKITY